MIIDLGNHMAQVQCDCCKKTISQPDHYWLLPKEVCYKLEDEGWFFVLKNYQYAFCPGRCSKGLHRLGGKKHLYQVPSKMERQKKKVRPFKIKLF